MAVRITLPGIDGSPAVGTIYDRPDGLTVEVKTLHQPQGEATQQPLDWRVSSITVSADPKSGQFVTAEDLARIVREFPAVMSALAGVYQYERAAAVASSGEAGDRIAQVAECYLEAVAAGDSPTDAVKERFVVERAQAYRMIRKARDLGLLPPTGRESK